MAAIALLVVAGAVAVVQSAGLVGGSMGERSQEVDLRDEITGAPLDAAGAVADEQAAELRARAASSRLRCEPQGCERWRLTLGEEWAPIGTTDGHVLFLRDQHLGGDDRASTGGDGPGTELLVIDTETGEEIVRRELAIQPAPRGSQPGSFAAAVAPGGIALAIDGTIVALDLEGVIRWQERLTDERVWYLRSHGDRLLVFAGDLRFQSSRSDPVGTPWEAGTIHLLDGDTGAPLWSAPGELSGTLDEEVAVLSTSSDGGSVTRAHDVDDGTVRWERATARVVHTAPGCSHVVLAGGGDGAGDVLVDAHTGMDLLSLGGTLVTMTARTDGSSYLLIDRTPRTDDDREPVVHGDDSDLLLLALDADGRLAWETEVDASVHGYVRLSAPADRLFLISERGATVAFDIATGDMDPVDPPSDTRTGPEVWTDSDGREIRPTADGLRIGSSTGWVQVRAEQGAWLVSDDPLLVTDGVTLLAVDPVPG